MAEQNYPARKYVRAAMAGIGAEAEVERCAVPGSGRLRAASAERNKRGAPTPC